METLLSVLAFLSALGAGLIAGLFFAFSIFVMTALERLPADRGVAAMQSINVAVLNPIFFAVFFGTGATALAGAMLALLQRGEPGTVYRLVGALLYLLGAILVTMVRNVPLNRRLAGMAASAAEAAGFWPRYVREWTRWNHLRTLASLAALACFILALR